VAPTPRPDAVAIQVPGRLGRAGAGLLCAGAVIAATSCSGAPVASPTLRLQRAAAATANAKSFEVRLLREEVIYQAPDRVEQIEHGFGSSASVSSNGTYSTSGLELETITKLYIGGRYYEAAGPTGKPAPFSVSARCAGNSNLADYVLGVLRAVSQSSDIHASGHGFAFTVPRGGAVPATTSGVATVAHGFVTTITVPVSGIPIEIDISSVNTAPPVPTPKGATDSTVSCTPVSGTSTASSGSASAPNTSSAP